MEEVLRLAIKSRKRDLQAAAVLRFCTNAVRVVVVVVQVSTHHTHLMVHEKVTTQNTFEMSFLFSLCLPASKVARRN